MDAERIVLADLLRPRGVRGEIVAFSQTDIPGRLEKLENVYVRRKDGTDLRVRSATGWPQKGLWVLKLEGVDSMDAAEALRGAEVWVPAAQRGELPPGEWFESDLVGCWLLDDRSGRRLGPVEGLQRYGGPALLQLAVDGREVLVPFVPEICKEVNLQTKTITACLPHGLLEL